MSSKLPQVTGLEAIEAFGKVGFTVVRVRGSHHHLAREGFPLIVTVPVHGHEALKKGTLRSLIRKAGLSVEEFIDLL